MTASCKLIGNPAYSFQQLDPKGFEACFRRWVGQVVTGLGGTIAVDGKTVRGSGTGGE